MWDDEPRSGVSIGILFVLSMLVALQATGMYWVYSTVTDLPDHRDIIEDIVDEYTEAGHASTTFDPADPLLADRKIVVTAAINERTTKVIAEKLLLLNSRDAREPIDLYLSTTGGWTISAYTVIDAIRLIEAPVNTWAVGECHSAGALILAAGTGVRRATNGAIMMVHVNSGSSNERYSYQRLDREREESFWRQRAALPEDWYPMNYSESYYLSATQALELGIIDEIREARNGARKIQPMTSE